MVCTTFTKYHNLLNIKLTFICFYQFLWFFYFFARFRLLRNFHVILIILLIPWSCFSHANWRKHLTTSHTICFSFLFSSKLFLSVNQMRSSSVTNPQGSLLGPLLFIIYINICIFIYTQIVLSCLRMITEIYNLEKHLESLSLSKIFKQKIASQLFLL